jgi:hypothetical protein
MKEGLVALTKLVEVVMSYRPDHAKKPKPQRRKRPPKPITSKVSSRDT